MGGIWGFGPRVFFTVGVRELFDDRMERRLSQSSYSAFLNENGC